MTMRKQLTLSLIFVLLAIQGMAQDKWDLRKCVEYAVANNISVKQADVQRRVAEVQAKQSQLGLYPSLSFGNGNRFSFGVSRNFNNQNLVEGTSLTSDFGFQSSVTLFNWFNKVNANRAAALEADAARESVNRARNDIALNVAAGYLQVLLAIEQRRVADVQLAQSRYQYENTRKLVDAGSLPELNAAELEAQIARDTSAVVTAYATVSQNILQLKALLNYDVAAPFEVDAPPVNEIPVEVVADLQPDYVYALALENQPLQRVNKIRILAAEKQALSAKGALYPSITLSGGIGTNYFLFFNQAITNPPFFKYLEDTRQQSLGINLSIPIFQGYSLRGNYQRANLNTENLILQQGLDNYNLKRDIYSAYIDATAALAKFNAQQKAVETAQKSYDYSSKRYEVGLLNSIDLIISQSNLTRAKIDQISAQFDYVFKMKVLEFYKGQGLKL